MGNNKNNNNNRKRRTMITLDVSNTNTRSQSWFACLFRNYDVRKMARKTNKPTFDYDVRKMTRKTNKPTFDYDLKNNQKKKRDNFKNDPKKLLYSRKSSIPKEFLQIKNHDPKIKNHLNSTILNSTISLKKVLIRIITAIFTLVLICALIYGLILYFSNKNVKVDDEVKIMNELSAEKEDKIMNTAKKAIMDGFSVLNWPK